MSAVLKSSKCKTRQQKIITSLINERHMLVDERHMLVDDYFYTYILSIGFNTDDAVSFYTKYFFLLICLPSKK